MNPHAPQPISINSLVNSLWRNRQLILQMTKRDVIGRYKGSVVGLLWSFFNPILMLTMYTFIFSVVFKARWGINGDETKSQFAMILFVGLMLHNFFSEVLNRAPGLVLGNVSYVKKVVFPLEILPAISMGAALFHYLISLFVLLIAFFIFNGFINWTAIFTPIIVLPLLMMTIGLAWALASLGVFLRDVGQTIGLVTTVLIFLSPVFYPMSALPEALRPWLMINPLTFPIEQARSVVILGNLPNWTGLAIYTAISVFVTWIGYVWFQKTRKGFSDVL